ncbi:MAG: aldehyde dehydrogenase family protein [Smithellaceae bacterium]
MADKNLCVLMCIDGKSAESSSKKTITVINPANEEIVGTVPAATSADVETVVKAARKAFDEGEWGKMTAAKRAEALRRMAALLTEKMPELSALLQAETGSTCMKASVDVGMPIGLLNYYADLICSPVRYDIGHVSPMPDEAGAPYSHGFVQRMPHGVCVGIVPWNFPFVLAFLKIAPGLAAGNTMIIKPPSEAPLAITEFIRMVNEAGILPPGVLNVITGSGREVGEALAAHPLVDKVAFTGSTEVGRRVMELAAPTVKVVTLELGGKSANIILDDADLDLAVEVSLFAFLFHSGQVCLSGTRCFAPKSKYEEILRRMANRVTKLVIGDPLDPATTMGPVFSRIQKETVESYIQSGLREGARLVCGGKPLNGKMFEKGFWVAPTIFGDARNDMTIAREEIFGPVLSVIPYETEDEAVAMANDTIYGLCGAVQSSNYMRAVGVAKRLQTGTVWINTYHTQGCNTPFSGWKQSGLGTELGVEGLMAYTRAKYIHVDLVCDGPARYSFLFSGK